MTGDDLLTPREVRLVAAIVAAPDATQAELAQEVGITDRYVRMLLAREPVRLALDAAARTGLREAASLAGRLSAKAMRALGDIIDDKRAPASARVAAAREIRESALVLSERREIIERLDRVEQLARASATPQNRPS
jgi:hypothetical protein